MKSFETEKKQDHKKITTITTPNHHSQRIATASSSILNLNTRIYKHSQSQLSTLSLKAPVSLSSGPQTSSAIELTTTSLTSVTEKI